MRLLPRPGTTYVVTLVLVAVALHPRDAFAYLDPSTGSMILSALVSVLVSAGLALHAYWHRAIAVARRLLRAPASGGGTEPGGSDATSGSDAPVSIPRARHPVDAANGLASAPRVSGQEPV